MFLVHNSIFVIISSFFYQFNLHYFIYNDILTQSQLTQTIRHNTKILVPIFWPRIQAYLGYVYLIK